MKRKISVLVMSVLLALTCLANSIFAAELPFTDVTKNWAYNSIKKSYEMKWVSGTSATTFSPKATITRAQFVTILANYAKVDTKKYTSCEFVDVDFKSWGYAPKVAWAKSIGIANGVDKTHFNPSGMINRAQIAVFFANYLKYLGLELEVVKPGVSFTDADKIPSYAKSSVMMLAKAGILSGSDGKFNAGDPCTREMAVTILVNFDNAVTRAKELSGGSGTTVTIKEKDGTDIYQDLKNAMRTMEQSGGGTVVIEKGQYTVSNTVFVPEKTKLVLKDGVVISRGNMTEHTIFAFARESDCNNGVKYTKHNGVKNSGIVAEKGATVVIDNEFGNTAVEIAHTTDVEISGITFKNMNGDFHFIECDSNLRLKIHDCSFSVASYTGKIKEAINLDVPDENTGGFYAGYSSLDKSNNEYIYIYDNIFENVNVAVGTHMYTDTAVHSHIYIQNNVMKNIACNAINVMNWSDVSITGNTITNIGINSKFDKIYDPGCVLKLRGVVNPHIKDNSITNATNYMNITPLFYADGEDINEKLYSYKTVYNTITSEEKAEMWSNTFDNVKYEYVLYKNTKDGAFETWYDPSLVKNSYTIGPNSATYLHRYEKDVHYNEKTKQFFVLQSYLDMAADTDERVTITLEPGVYKYVDAIFIPSNVTITLSEGTTIKHSDDTGLSSTFGSKRLFVFADNAEKYANINSVADYGFAAGGVINGHGKIDMEGQSFWALIVPKSSGATIEGVTFVNAPEKETYIRVWSSKNVSIKDCRFDGGDKVSSGILLNSLYNNKPCKNVSITNCSFDGMDLGIQVNFTGTTADYCTDFTVDNCSFAGQNSACITGVGLKNLTLTGNQFDFNKSGYCIKINGLDTARDISDNIFTNVTNCVQITYKAPFNVNVFDNQMIRNYLDKNDFNNAAVKLVYRASAAASAVTYK